MRSVRTGALIGVALASAFTAFNVINCASATTITLEVRGDNDICSDINETGIAVTTKDGVDSTSDFPLQQFQAGCKSGGKIGTLVITPHTSESLDRNAHIGIRVVSGLRGKTANACDSPDGTVAADCIIAKRTVSFTEGANVPLTVTLNGRCVHFTCDPGFTCNPDEEDPAKRCIDQTKLDPGSSSSGGSSEDATRPPIDTGPEPEKDSGADTGPPTPEELCNKPGRTFTGGKCVVNCGPGYDDCKKPDTCPPGLDCQFVCAGPKACEGVSCLGNRKCEFVCAAADQDLCHNIVCDAGSCNVRCRVGENACNGVTLTGKVNTVSCQKGGAGQDKVSCDDVNCVPGPGNGSCERSCDGPPPNACGPKAICDAGDCTKFEGGT